MFRNIKFDRAMAFKIIATIILVVFSFEMRFTAMQLTGVNTSLNSDALEYYSYAYNISENKTYSRSVPGVELDPDKIEMDFLRPPGFPFFASLFYSENPNEFVKDTLIAQLIINSAVIFLLIIVGWSIFGYWPVFCVALLYATSPHIINMNLYFLSESIMISLMVMLVVLLYKAFHGGRFIVWALLGLVLAYASITRPYLKYFILILVPFCFWVFRGKNSALIATMFLCMVIPFGAWSTFVSLNGGKDSNVLMIKSIHHGLYPNLEYNHDPLTMGYPYRFNPESENIEKDMKSVTHEVLRRFMEEPLSYSGWFLLGKPLMLWQWGIIQGAGETYIYQVATPPWDYLPHFKISYALHKTLHYPLVFFAFLFSIIVWIPRFSEKLVSDKNNLIFFRSISLLLVYGTAIHIVGAPLPRYQIPQKIMMFIMGIGFCAYIIPFALKNFRRAS